MMPKGAEQSEIHNRAAIGEVLLLLHGIRTDASWAEMVVDTFGADTQIKVIPIRYGYFDTFRFLFPFWTRDGPVKRIQEEISQVRTFYPNAKISVIAHSFGTYALIRALRDRGIHLNRVLLCGSIVSERFRVSTYREQLQPDCIVNDCGTHDIWPVFAKAVSWGYGATGTFGFGTTGVIDRFHKFSHSEYFSKSFVENYWVPYFRDGEVRKSEWEKIRSKPPFWMSFLSWFPMKSIVGIGLLGIAVFPILQSKYLSESAIELGNSAWIGQYVGVAQLIVELNFKNPTRHERTFSNMRVSLVSPTAKVYPLDAEGIVIGNVLKPPLSDVLVQTGSENKFRYGYLSDTSGVALVLRKVLLQAAKLPEARQPWDENNVIVSDPLLTELNKRAEDAFIWTKGRWKLSLRYTIANNQKSAVRYFDVTEIDILRMRKNMPYYGSGLGVLPNWRNLGPDGLYVLREVTLFRDIEK